MLCPCPCCKPKGKLCVPAAAVTTQGRKLGCPRVFRQVVRTSTLCEPEGFMPCVKISVLICYLLWKQGLGGFQIKSGFLTQRKTWREQTTFQHDVRLFYFWRLLSLEGKKSF